MSEPGSEANAVRRFTFRPLSVLLAGTPQSDRGRIALARFRSSAKMRQSSEWTSGPGCGEAASRHLRSNSHKSKTITITIPMPSMLFITLTRASCNNNWRPSPQKRTPSQGTRSGLVVVCCLT